MFSFDYVSLFLIILNIFVFLLFAFLIFVIIRSYKTSAGEEEEMIKQQAFKKAQAMLDASREKSLQILKDSTSKAKDVINNVEYLTEDVKNQLNSEFSKLSDSQIKKIDTLSNELMSEYKKVLSEEKNKSLASLHEVSESMKNEANQELANLRNVSDDMESEARKELSEFRHISEKIEHEAAAEIEEFRKTLAQETVASEKLVQERVNQEYEEMRQRIRSFEEEKMRQIDERINVILSDVAKEVFGSGIDLSTSEQMVMAALNKAKKEGMFGK